MNPDQVNACFEGAGAILNIMNIRQILRDKVVHGVTVWPTIFFITWGLWNLFYYRNLNQVTSFVAAGGLVLVNLVWVGLFIFYQRKD